MVKRFLRAKFWQHAGLVLVMVALLAMLHGNIAGSSAVLAARKKVPAPEMPALRATLTPVLTIPVEPLGFSAPGAFYLGMRNSLVSLDFLDENRILFTFRVPGLMHREVARHENEDERMIRAVVLRLPQGTIDAETVWTIHDRGRYLYTLDNGQFLLRDRNDLKIGDASLQLKPYLQFPGHVLWVEMDPSKQYLVTGSDEPAAKSAGNSPTAAEGGKSDPPADTVLRIFRRSTGQAILVTRVRDFVHVPVNQEGYLEMVRSKGDAWLLNFTHFDGGSKVLGTVQSDCMPRADFVSPDQMLFTTCKDDGEARLVAMSTSGRRLWQNDDLGQTVWPLVITSRNGTRMARESLLATHGVNASAPLGTDDIKGQDVQVFDVLTGKTLLRAQASPTFDAGGNVGFSPSGNRIAILMQGGIQIFDLPRAGLSGPKAEDRAGR